MFFNFPFPFPFLITNYEIYNIFLFLFLFLFQSCSKLRNIIKHIVGDKERAIDDERWKMEYQDDGDQDEDWKLHWEIS